MTKDNAPATDLTDDELDTVQGGYTATDDLWQVKTRSKGGTGDKRVILSSESHEPAFKRGAEGVILSSETHEPTDK